MCGLGGYAAQYIAQRRRGKIEIHENERPPNVYLNRPQAVLGFVEVAHAFELGRVEQLTGETVGPGVIHALERLAIATTCGDRAGTVAANIKEGMQRAAGVARYH